MAQEKQYGLILPGKNKVPAKVPPTASKKKNVFGEGDSSEEESTVDWVRQSLKKQSHGSMQQKQSMKVMKKALEDDPSVYEYDEVYDEMERKKEETKQKAKGDKKPKYIEGLLKTAKQRELENELRRERLAQKEREDEGDEFEDKEAFVTAAYKKKMEDIRKMQDDQAQVDAVDDLTEVTKQKDLSGFYRYLYREKMKEETPTTTDSKAVTDATTEPEAIKTEPEVSPTRKESSPEVNNRPSPDSDGPRGSSRSPERRLETRDKSPKSPDRRRDRHEDLSRHQHRRDSHRQRRSRSGSYGREKRRRHESPQERRRDHDRNRRDRSRSHSRDRGYLDRDNKNRHDRHRRSNSRDNISRDRRRDDRSRHDRENRRPVQNDRSKYFNREESDKGKDRSGRGDSHDRKIDNKSSKDSKSEKDSKIKIIQNKNENWYDFDVEIEREVNKDFYAKRTVGKAFDDALQRYLTRKGPEQELDPKSKYN